MKFLFRCSQCNHIVESTYDISGDRHDIVPSGECDGSGTLIKTQTMIETPEECAKILGNPNGSKFEIPEPDLYPGIIRVG